LSLTGKKLASDDTGVLYHGKKRKKKGAT